MGKEKEGIPVTRTRGDFSQGRVSAQILRLGTPLMLAELVHVLYSVVDRMYIGHMGEQSTVALTGIGVSFPLVTLIGAFANLFSTGGATLATIARGEGDDPRAERIMGTAFALLVAVGAALTVLLYTTAPVTLRLLGGDDTTMPAALDYFTIYVLGTIPVLITLGMNPYINAQGFPRVGMLTVIIGAALNIALDPLFIFVLGMGVKGAALATVLSQAAGAAWVLRFLCGRKAALRLRGLRIDPAEVGGILKLGATGFTFKVTNSVTQAIVNIMLKSWGGAASTLYIGAMSLINSLREIVSLPVNGMTAAAQNVMSYNYGAKKGRRVSEAIRFTLISGLAVNTAMWALILLIPGLLFSVFSDDGALIDLAARCGRVYFGAFPMMALQLTGQMTFVSLNRPKHALFFSLLRKMILVAPLTLLLPAAGLGAMGVFWAEFISQLVGAAACFTTMSLLVWRHIGELGQEPEAPEV